MMNSSLRLNCVLGPRISAIEGGFTDLSKSPLNKECYYGVPDHGYFGDSIERVRKPY